jgi:hypothetical protein
MERKIVVYTTLVVLNQMRHELGLEPMILFLERYIRSIEKSDPYIKEVIDSEMKKKALFRIYQNMSQDQSF